MAKVGKKPEYRKEFHPLDFIVQSKEGFGLAQIAASWDIDRTCLWRWEKKYPEFGNAVKIGKDLCEAWYANIGRRAMLGMKVQVKNKNDVKEYTPQLGWFVWMTKNMFKWNDRAALEHSGPEGKPIETTHHSDLTDDQLRSKIEKLLEKRKA